MAGLDPWSFLRCVILTKYNQFQALESEAVLGRFRTVYEKMNSALDGMPYAELGISDEVMEQVLFMHPIH